MNLFSFLLAGNQNISFYSRRREVMEKKKKQMSIYQIISNEDLPNFHRFKHETMRRGKTNEMCVYTYCVNVCINYNIRKRLDTFVLMNFERFKYKYVRVF